MPTRRLPAVASRQPLLAHLLNSLPLKRADVKKLLKHGAVTVNQVVVRQFDHPVLPSDIVETHELRAAVVAERLQKAGIQVVYEDEALIVVDKPAGLLTVATDREAADTLFVRVNEYLHSQSSGPAARVWIVHRIDRETSGLVLLAKSEAVKQRLQESWPAVEKTYLAVVRGRPEVEQGKIATYLSEDAKSLQVSSSDRPTPLGRLAITHYRLIKTRDDRSLIEVRLETGRKHQIRVHLANLGCPVVGDRRYGHKSLARERLALHASGLRLIHPVTGQPLHLSSPLPKGHWPRPH